MDLLNATRFVAGYTQGMDKTGRESIVVVVKATFTLPLDGTEPMLAEVQEPLVDADSFTGEPGFSATLCESDFAPVKPKCDVLLNASAYAPGGKPATSVEVGVKVSTITKVFNVVGNRYWYTGGGGVGKTSPQPFETKPITYDVAFGGLDDFHPDKEKRNAYMANPVGKGYHYFLNNKLLHNTPLPNTEERGKTVSNPAGKYTPMAFGPRGRGWPERAQYGGTYDQKWVDEVFPFLPEDFDNRYFQAAPEDQQCDYLQGGELVQLLNLTKAGRTSFTIPNINVPVVFFRNKGENEHKKAVLDTLLIEPEKGVFSMVWRTSMPLKKNMFEVPQVLVGTKSRAWWRARELGKTYYSSLAGAVAGQSDDED